MSPIVEEELQRHIGIKCPWHDDHFGTFMALLIEEINEHTPWRLRLMPWKHYAWCRHRILDRKESASEDLTVRGIQLYALDNGRQLGDEQVRRMLRDLLALADP